MKTASGRREKRKCTTGTNKGLAHLLKAQVTSNNKSIRVYINPDLNSAHGTRTLPKLHQVKVPYGKRDLLLRSWPHLLTANPGAFDMPCSVEDYEVCVGTRA